jgi:DNA-binding transcriptional ArsR family regulator
METNRVLDVIAAAAPATRAECGADLADLSLLLDAPEGEWSVGELVTAINAPQSRVSTHLGCLRWCGLVEARREGKQVYYCVADARVRDLLAVAGDVLRDHAAGIASCEVIR